MNEESREFLRAYFGDDLTGVYVCDSNSMNRPQLAATAVLDPKAGWYWCPARLSGLDERGQRVAKNAVSVHGLVIDDVGRKVDQGEFALFASAPLTMLTTSEGNAQAGYRLEGVTPQEFAALRARVPWEVDGLDCIHWWRLPGGVHLKSGGRPVGPLVWGKGDLLSWLPAEPFRKVRAAGEKATDESLKAPSLEAVQRAVASIPNDAVWDAYIAAENGEEPYDAWVRMGHAIKGAVGEEGLEVWVEWCGRRAEGQGVDPADKWHDDLAKNPDNLGWPSIEKWEKHFGGREQAKAAFDDGVAPPDEKVNISRRDFFAHMQTGKFVYFPTGELWPAASVNARLGPSGEVDAKGKPVPVSEVLKRTRAVDQVSWMPGRLQIVRDVVVTKAGVEREKDNVVLNLYRGPVRADGVAQHSLPWRRHLEMLYPDDAEWIMKWMAHCIQKPWEKKNHALVLGGPSGVGKDTILHPLILGVGGQNFTEATPTALMGRFNAFLQAVVLRISEVHNLGENLTRRKLYEHLKPILAAPPETLQIDAKNVEVRSILNVVSVLMTTNYRHEGFFLPEEDRRHYMAWTDVTERAVKQDKGSDYYAKLHKWMEGGGAGHVVALLRAVNLAGWDAKAPPPKTKWWYSVVGVSTQDANDEALEDAIAALGGRAVFSKKELMSAAEPGLQAWIDDPRNQRAFPARLLQQGYENFLGKGRWSLKGRQKVTLYTRKELSTVAAREACEAWVAKENENIGKAKRDW